MGRTRWYLMDSLITEMIIQPLIYPYYYTVDVLYLLLHCCALPFNIRLG